MDFTFSTEQDEAAALAAKILADATGPGRLAEVEARGDRFDRELWATLGSAFEWDELDLLTLARVLVEVGRYVAPLPLAPHAACVAFLRSRGLSAEPGALCSAAVAEELEHLPTSPTVRADADGLLTGVKTLVRAGMAAEVLLVTAAGPAGPGVYLVAADASGVERAAQRTIDADLTARVTFAGAPAQRIGDADAVGLLGQLLTALACAEQLGVVEGALAETATYAGVREQFDRPIGSFQAVSQRLADGYIDALCLRLTTWQALWRLAEGLPAGVEVATAQLWAADAGHRVAHTAVHVHGGVGIDLDGVTHRFFTAAKRFEFACGGATQQALAIGRALAIG